MSYPDLSGISKDSGGNEAAHSVEETLRLIARLPAPKGLEERLKVGLRSAPRTGRVLEWPSPMSSGWLGAAAAAAIVFVVAGGGWGIYSRVQPGRPTRENAGPRMAAPGGFTEGGAVRRPQTLTGPVVAVPAVANPAVKAPATVATPKAKVPGKDAGMALLPGRPAAEKKAKAQPAASPVQ